MTNLIFFTGGYSSEEKDEEARTTFFELREKLNKRLGYNVPWKNSVNIAINKNGDKERKHKFFRTLDFGKKYVLNNITINFTIKDKEENTIKERDIAIELAKTQGWSMTIDESGSHGFCTEDSYMRLFIEDKNNDLLLHDEYGFHRM